MSFDSKELKRLSDAASKGPWTTGGHSNLYDFDGTYESSLITANFDQTAELREAMNDADSWGDALAEYDAAVGAECK